MSAGIPPVDKTPVNTGVPGSTPNPLQSKPFQPTEDTTTSMNETSEDCCFVKILKAIRNFFKSICSCLCGRSKEETKPEVPKTGDGSQNPPPTDPKKLDAFQAEIAARCAKQAGAKQAAERFMTNVYQKESWQPCVKKFGEIPEPDVQWWVLSMLMERPAQHVRLGHIASYIGSSKAIEKEVCEKFPSLKSAKEICETGGPVGRQELQEFFQSKVGTPAPAPTPASSAPKDDPAAVQAWLAQKAGLKPNAWFKSDKCDDIGRAQILLHLAKYETNCQAIGLYLGDWALLLGPTHKTIVALKAALNITGVGLYQEKHKQALIDFLEKHLKSLPQAEPV